MASESRRRTLAREIARAEAGNGYRGKVHFRNIRLFVNAGMRFPECYAGADLLDTDKSGLETTGNRGDVTCKRCLRILARGRQ